MLGVPSATVAAETIAPRDERVELTVRLRGGESPRSEREVHRERDGDRGCRELHSSV